MFLLSFDIEEFDLPFEYGQDILFEEQMKISEGGTWKILQLLKKHDIKATFYVTANFAQNAPEIINQIVFEGHELASHGFYHSSFEPLHLKTSKEALEALGKTKVQGYRMARMMPVSEFEIKNAGYVYNSSINPTFLPGRYNNMDKPRTCFRKEGILQLPTSVTPVLRIPLFWLSFHNFSLSIYKYLVKRTYIKDNYLNTYFHCWEFMPMDKMKYLPYYIRKNTGESMLKRLDKFIYWALKQDYIFGLTKDFVYTQSQQDNEK